MRVPTRAKEKEKGRAGVRVTRLSLRNLQQRRIRQVYNPAKGQRASSTQKGHALGERIALSSM